MKSIKRNLSILSALALAGLAAVSAPAPVSAQSIFASPNAARAAGVPGGGGYGIASQGGYMGGYARGGMSAMDTTSGGTGTAPAPAPASGDPYAAIFGQIQTATSGLLSGPGAMAFGVLILGLGFGVAWRLVTKGVKSIGK